GDATSLQIGGDHVGPVKIGGEIRGTASNPISFNVNSALKSLTVGGSVTWTNLVLSTTGAQVGAVKVGGSWTASNLQVAVAPGMDGMFGTSDDIPVAGSAVASKIVSIVIGGTVSGTVGGTDSLRFEAEQIGSFKVGDTVFAL